MAKKNESIMEMVEVEGPLVERPASETVREIKDEPVNCLRNERIIVRHIAKQTGIVTDPSMSYTVVWLAMQREHLWFPYSRMADS